MTTSADLIAAFADRTTLPIDLNEVAAWLLDRGIQDEINFIPVDLDIGVIRGFLRRIRRAKGGWDIDPDDVSNVYYDREQGADWIQFVCAKELLHILDAARCASRADFERLTRSLALPADMKQLAADPSFASVDKLGGIPAAALLLPAAARELLMPAYEAGLVSDLNIAELAMIPEQHVRAVMSPIWPAVYKIVVGDQTPDDDGVDDGVDEPQLL